VIAVIDQPAALVLDWIDLGANKSAAAEALGRGLAQQHRSTTQTYGLDHDNYIGSTPQRNTPTRSWIEFFRDRRLGVQRSGAAQRLSHVRSGTAARSGDGPPRSMDRRRQGCAVTLARRPVGRQHS
jgi:fructosamine-3-kinase